jgi:hypothetical protein
MLARGSFVLVLLTLVSMAAPASAKAVHDSAYSYKQIFGSTLRMLKVDLDLEVVETNSDWGFLRFVYTHPESGDRKNRASFTFVQTNEGVKVALQIPAMPMYHEQMIIEKLRVKLNVEHGEPPPKKKPDEKKPKKDDDDDGDEEKGDKDAKKDEK